MKRMLFNATQQEELRVAIVDGQRLIDIDIESAGREERKSNIYKAVITRIEPSLEACFVNYGEDRHGFLPFKEVARTYFKEGVDVRTASIKEALREGQEIMVQIDKEERGNKGAALTSFVSLAGRYLVLMPNNPRGGGVSRRVEGEERQELRETMDQLDLPAGMSVIARTAGIGRNVEELQWDLNYLMQLWRAIEGAGQSASGAFLIYQESSLVIRAIRDYFQPEIGEILIDTDEIYDQAQQFMAHVMPDMVHRVKRYRDEAPLFSRFQIEHQIETAYSRTVPLPSGGAIVIDHTEALVSVDVNSARATRGSDIESTAFNTNLEAAEEVARQLRLRDLGGLIVIDFIDMDHSKHQREVEGRLKDALRHDRARVQMGKISRFGLMELSRQRLRPSLSEGSHVACPRCNGTGHIRDIESSALQVLRIIQEEAMKENSAAIHVQAPVDVAAFLLNEKRGDILQIETRHGVSVILIPNKHLETPHYKLERIKSDDARLEDSTASYAMAEEADTDISYDKRQKEEVKARQEAVVKGITPDQPAPIVDRRPVDIISPHAATEEGFFSRLFGLFRAKPVTPAVATTPAAPEKTSSGRDRTDRPARSQRSRNRSRNPQERNEENIQGRNQNSQQVSALKTAPSDSATSGRPPRPPREPREPREARDNSSEERNENRRERQANGNARGGRDERNDNASDLPKDEVVLAIDTPIPAVVQVSASRPAAAPSDETDDLSSQTEDVAETTTDADGEEQPRRRRRRGGRNRSRRDRDTDGTETTANGSAPFVPVEELELQRAEQEKTTVQEAQGEEHLTDEPETSLAVEDISRSDTPRQAPRRRKEASERVDTATANEETSAAATTEPAPADNMAAQPAEEAVSVAHVAQSAPAADEQNTASSEVSAETTPETDVQPAAEATSDRSELSLPQMKEISAKVTEAAETAVEAPALEEQSPVVNMSTDLETEPVFEELTSAQASASEEKAATTSSVQASSAEEVTEEAIVADQFAVTSQAVFADQDQRSDNELPADLENKLDAAGLTLTVTDPAKLQAAQETAAQEAAAPARQGRMRKPQPSLAAEPLVQVETQREA